MAIVLGTNQYGKAEVRMVFVDRSTPVHTITDVNVTSQLVGDFTDTHLTGANDDVIATDTQKNTVYAMARTGGVGSPEEFALRLARNYVDKYDQVTGARMAVEQYSWDRIVTSAGPHDHAFSKGTAESRTTVVRKDGAAETVISGLTGLVVLKSTGSEFWGFPDVEYTSLVETTDRILATAVTARWLYTSTDIDWDAAFTTRAPRCWRTSRPRTACRCSRRCTPWARGRWRPCRRSRRSGCPCRTSTTSWSTSASGTWTTRTRCSMPPTGPTG